MKKSSSELKCMAKESLIGKYGLLIGAALLYGGISMASTAILNMAFQTQLLTFPSLLSLLPYLLSSIIVSLLFSLLETGYCKMILNISRKEETRLKDLFFCFSHQPDRILLLTICVTLLSLACMIPGILLLVAGVFVKSSVLILISIFAVLAGIIFTCVVQLSYSLGQFLYLDAPEKGTIQLLRESRSLMKGNKGRLLYLTVSFLGLILLCTLTCFLGYLWLTPYMAMTFVLFYRDLLGEFSETNTAADTSYCCK